MTNDELQASLMALEGTARRFKEEWTAKLGYVRDLLSKILVMVTEALDESDDALMNPPRIDPWSLLYEMGRLVVNPCRQ